MMHLPTVILKGVGCNANDTRPASCHTLPGYVRVQLRHQEFVFKYVIKIRLVISKAIYTSLCICTTNYIMIHVISYVITNHGLTV